MELEEIFECDDYHNIELIGDAYCFLKNYLVLHSDDEDLRFNLEIILSFVSLECELGD